MAYKTNNQAEGNTPCIQGTRGRTGFFESASILDSAGKIASMAQLLEKRQGAAGKRNAACADSCLPEKLNGLKGGKPAGLKKKRLKIVLWEKKREDFFFLDKQTLAKKKRKSG